MLRAHGNEEGVIVAEQLPIGRQVRFDERSERLGGRPRIDESMAAQYAACVVVDGKHGAAGRVEQDGIGRLRPEAPDRQQILPQRREGRAPHLVEASAETLEQPARECKQPAGGRPRRRPGALQVGLGRRGQTRGVHEAAGTQRANGVRPLARWRGSGEDRAHGDLVRCPFRPGAPRAVAALQRDVEAKQPGLDPVARRAGNPTPAREQRTA
jgi:hypothetical protein